MKIRWLDDDYNSAVITKGFLWWRRCAKVRKITNDEWGEQAGTNWWRYVPSDRPCEEDISSALLVARHYMLKAREKEKHRSDWYRPSELPSAKVVSR